MGAADRKLYRAYGAAYPSIGITAYNSRLNYQEGLRLLAGR